MKGLVSMLTTIVRDIHEFTQVDWYGFAGVDRFEDGSAPLMCEMKIDDNGVFCMAHKDGVTVDVFLPEDTEMSYPVAYVLPMKASPREEIVNKFQQTVDALKTTLDIETDLMMVGFDCPTDFFPKPPQ